MRGAAYVGSSRQREIVGIRRANAAIGGVNLQLPQRGWHLGGPIMKVAIFTDNDFSKVNGVTTTLRAVLTHAPADIQPRVYTCESKNVQEPQYFAVGTRYSVLGTR